MAVRKLFIDMNAFFASVEQQDKPELRGRPVAVIPTDAETTSCIAASYEAKRFGVRDPEPGFYATFDLPGVATLDGLGDMVVLGGQPGQEAETVLRQSDKLVVALRTGGEG